MRAFTPNYSDMGDAHRMGVELRKLVEGQLKDDLKHYGIDKEELKFDWSESCVEGHSTYWLDGSVENFSGIGVFDANDRFVAAIWMEFIDDKETDFFIAYCEFVTTYDGDKVIAEKADVGIPAHVWSILPEKLRSVWKDYRRKTARRLP